MNKEKYNKEWENDLKKKSKDFLISFLKKALLKNIALQAEKEKLMSDFMAQQVLDQNNEFKKEV